MAVFKTKEKTVPLYTGRQQFNTTPATLDPATWKMPQNFANLDNGGVNTTAVASAG